MLHIIIPANEMWDEKAQVFIPIKEQALQLEHSLVSISKWESRWKKSFLKHRDKTYEETVDYIKCMTITQNVDPKVYLCLTNKNIRQVNEYIEDPMTASHVPDIPDSKGGPKDTMTAEMIYYCMIVCGIPFECQKWHLNRLLTLIRICNAKNRNPKKMSSQSVMRNNKAINAARRKRHHSRG